MNNQATVTELSAAEILTWYRGNRHIAKVEADKVSSTSFQTLLQLMTPEQRQDAVFSDAEFALYRKGGETAVTARRQRNASQPDPDDLTQEQMRAMAEWNGSIRK